MRRFLAVPLLAALALLGACGGSDQPSSTGSTTATTAAGSTAAPAPPVGGAATTPPDGATTSAAPRATNLTEARAVVKAGNRLTDTQADCVVGKLVAAVGEAGALALVNDSRDIASLPAADARTATSALLACVPAADFAKVISSTFYDALKDVGVTQAQATCFGDKLVTTLTPEAMVALGSGATEIDRLDPATQGKVLAALAACLPPDLLGQLGAGLGADGAATTTAPGATTTAKP